MRKLALALLFAVGAAGLATVVPSFAGGGPGPLSPALQQVHEAVARFNSFDQAERAGYLLPPGEPCVASPAGTMGFHVINPARLADLDVDPLQPEILLYTPNENGKLKFVGIEYWAIALAKNESGPPTPWFSPDPPPLGFFNPAPTLFGQTFDGPMAGHNAEMPWHYDLHVWVADSNPSGLFAPFNPALSC